MKKYLLQEQSNQRWVDNQESQHASYLAASTATRELRMTMYPELELCRVRSVQQSLNVKEILMMARQRQLFKDLMVELAKLNLGGDTIEAKSSGGNTI